MLSWVLLEAWGTFCGMVAARPYAAEFPIWIAGQCHLTFPQPLYRMENDKWVVGIIIVSLHIPSLGMSFLALSALVNFGARTIALHMDKGAVWKSDGLLLRDKRILFHHGHTGRDKEEKGRLACWYFDWLSENTTSNVALVVTDNVGWLPV